VDVGVGVGVGVDVGLLVEVGVGVGVWSAFKAAMAAAKLSLPPVTILPSREGEGVTVDSNNLFICAPVREGL
jgi:hypothetical protein